MNRSLAIHVIEELMRTGTAEFVLCPGARNAPLVDLITESHLPHVFWFEERSAAFYALGKARRSGRPVAVITTSGTAAGELLPALMEAFYTSVPLIAVTADRPRNYRGTNAPQTAEQVGLFGIYTPLQIDLAWGDYFTLRDWKGRTPVHLNICFEKPARADASHRFLPMKDEFQNLLPVADATPLQAFLQKAHFPLVVVSALSSNDRAAVIDFLLLLGAPVYLEATSNLRCEPRLAHLRVYDPQLRWHDAVIRIGGIPTHGLWRDVDRLPVLSISEHPFTGTPEGALIHTQLSPFFKQLNLNPKTWAVSDDYFPLQHAFQKALLELMQIEPSAEQALVYQLSKALPLFSHVYLGNSLPIREWDLCADYLEKQLDVQASRGLNGIDGQLSCFFGLCKPERLNLALIGDLTALYDFAGLWFTQQCTFPYALVIINNSGGKIFAPMFENVAMQNRHTLRFEKMACFWQIPYQEWREVPTQPNFQGLIELLPDPEATLRFSNQLDQIRKDVHEEASMRR